MVAVAVEPLVSLVDHPETGFGQPSEHSISIRVEVIPGCVALDQLAVDDRAARSPSPVRTRRRSPVARSPRRSDRDAHPASTLVGRFARTSGHSSGGCSPSRRRTSPRRTPSRTQALAGRSVRTERLDASSSPARASPPTDLRPRRHGLFRAPCPRTVPCRKAHRAPAAGGHVSINRVTNRRCSAVAGS